MDVLAVIDRQRKVFNTDYVDSMLIHCMVKDGWTDQWKAVMDGFNQAKGKGWIRSKGVSCHSLPALRAATVNPWAEVHLVRINPQGRRMDGPEEIVWPAVDEGHEVSPVLSQIKAMRAKGRGIIGMKIIGNGEFVDAADREKSIRFAMSLPELDSVVIGFKSRAEIDEAIQRINRRGTAGGRGDLMIINDLPQNFYDGRVRFLLDKGIYRTVENGTILSPSGKAAATRMTTAKQYDNLNRLTSIGSGTSASTSNSFADQYNPANQRNLARLVAGSYWRYGYDALGQVVSDCKYWSDGTPVAGQQFDYAFDTICGRIYQSLCL